MDEPMERTDLARAIYQRAHLTGEFKLRSGAIATEYFDKYRFESDPTLLHAIAVALAPLVPPDVDVLAGLELGGVPIATVLSQLTGLPTVFVRKEPKAYGTCRLAEGGDIEGRRLLIVEDVATTGGQMIESAGHLRAAGAIIEQAIVVIDREQGASANLEANRIALRALFSLEELRAAAAP
jgi:orotate phosphoribosyltransferase